MKGLKGYGEGEGKKAADSVEARPEYDCLIHQAVVLTMEPGAAPLENGYVAIRGGCVAAVGAVGTSGELPAAGETLEAEGLLVMPGLVNTHCHAAMVWFRGLADDLPLNRWLREFIFPAEAEWLTPEKAYWGAKLAAAELIRGGVTTVADGYFFEAEVRRALQEAGLRAVLAQGVVDFPAPGVPNPRDNLKTALEFIDTDLTTAGGLVTSTLFCHSPYTCSAETLARAKDLTRTRNLPFFIHLAESRRELVELRERTGFRPTTYLESLGILDELTVAIHAVCLSPDDLAILADRRVKVSHCPESNAKLGVGVAPVPELLAHGVTVGLGTDGAGSNNNLDLWGEMSMAARLHKVWRNDPTVLPAAQVVGLATREGARVLGLQDTIGTLTPGQAADLIVLNLRASHLTPRYEPFSHLVYAAGPGDVQHVMVAGRWLMRDRQLLTLEWEEIAARIEVGRRELQTFFRK